MQTWYYSKNGEQRGPVSQDELGRLVSGGELNPKSDLAWTAGMTDWQPVGTLPAFAGSGPSAAVQASPDAFNPYASPATSPDNILAPRDQSGGLSEIQPGSVQLGVIDCIKRGYELTLRHFGSILVIGVVYLAVTFVLGIVEEFISTILRGGAAIEGETAFHPLMLPVSVISFIISIVLGAGLSRVALDFCSGRETSVGVLFGETGKVVSLVASSVLFYVMMAAGLLLLVVPGIYVALRLGFFITAIVDRNLGPIEALKYSYRITTNNALPLFGLGILLMLIALAGALALLLGLVVAIPVATLAFTLAYRFLQFGPDALLDPPSGHPLTTG